MRISSFLGSLLIALPPLALAADSLDVKLGLWEVTYATEMQGSMIPKSVLDKMPPAQRAKMEADMQKRAAGGPEAHVHKSCVTAKDIKEGAFRASEDKGDHSCKTTISAQSSTLQEATVTCGGKEPRTSHIKVQSQGRERMTGSIENTMERGKITVKLSGKWIGESCTGVNE